MASPSQARPPRSSPGPAGSPCRSLQDDFDPNLVRLFDKYAQGSVGSTALSAGESLSVTIDGSHAQAWSARLTDQFGFADFETTNGALRVARPVAVAETAGAADDTIAIVRVRQNGENNVALSFYRVDDLDGAIGGLRPGDAAYAGAAQGRAYELTTGGTSLGGPGYGNFEQAGLRHVDAGDIIAFRLTDNTSGAVFWGFAQGNETVGGQKVGHLWNYGLNTWGFEDMSGGGDHDYNDLVVRPRLHQRLGTRLAALIFRTARWVASDATSLRARHHVLQRKLGPLVEPQAPLAQPFIARRH